MTTRIQGTVLFLLFLFLSPCAPAQITIDLAAEGEPTAINPLLYGQFIEHLGRCVDGGLYEEDSPLSDARGFRTDVLEKVKALDVPLLRFPGGTVTKIYHWEYGIGPKEDRPKRPNLIWGGNINYHFGTAEFIAYCREIGAEPMLVVNMATGTPEEASNWVEYCNGTGDTHYANLRREHGYPEPFNVKYWGIGNEESADADAGRHYTPERYTFDTWQFAKLMKLQDRSITLTMVGDTRDPAWNREVLEELHPVTDYLAAHFYAVPGDPSFASLLRSVYQYDAYLDTLRTIIGEFPDQGGLSRWYRFPGRRRPLKLAIDEWGIWDMDSPKGRGTYNLEYPFSWQHALATAGFFHIFYDNADIIELATWAQTVNILAPIMTTPEGSYVQTVYTPLQKYRQHMLNRISHRRLVRKDDGRPHYDYAVTTSGNRKVVAVINYDDTPLDLRFSEPPRRRLTYSAPTLEATNGMDRQVVRETEDDGAGPQGKWSIGLYFFGEE